MLHWAVSLFFSPYYEKRSFILRQFGDRLLSINGVQVINFKDAMATLRSVPIGEKATLVFSRQDSVVVTTPSTSSPILIDPSTDRSSTCAFNITPDLVFKSVRGMNLVLNFSFELASLSEIRLKFNQMSVNWCSSY